MNRVFTTRAPGLVQSNHGDVVICPGKIYVNVNGILEPMEQFLKRLPPRTAPLPAPMTPEHKLLYARVADARRKREGR